MLTIDPYLFTDEAISEETRTFNKSVVEQLTDAPDSWGETPFNVRLARLEGKGIFPLEPEEPSAVNFNIEGKSGPLSIRCFQPKEDTPKGTFLHIHGGGWQVGSALAHEVRLQEIADRTSLTCLSVEYRLAPEHPYPAGPDDCETAALWLFSAQHDFNTETLVIGGESAGAHLTVSTLLRLRDGGANRQFDAAVLTAGVFDLGQTASTRNWGDEKLILNTRDMTMFVNGYLHHGENTRDPAISPLFASLDDMPPAIFSIGTRDLLLDDTLMMATRWHVQNGNAVLDVAPGGCHVFQSMRHLKIARDSNQRIDDFVVAIRDR